MQFKMIRRCSFIHKKEIAVPHQESKVLIPIFVKENISKLK
ncbi:hypothetical protein L21SP2_2087 [Salinispira pacifica]|uniref:Uncharacterized protein n=1 Tax=Salinispira pacifica TaxID=1307761 RepID=V5WIR0_9SPIO|nr:hypothetical protein L21SP2_2087 [Salinispira pacifica]